MQVNIIHEKIKAFLESKKLREALNLHTLVGRDLIITFNEAVDLREMLCVHQESLI